MNSDAVNSDETDAPQTGVYADLEPNPQVEGQTKSGDEGRIRLQKVLAAAGVASRRNSEQLIVDGRVSVDGRIVDQLGARVDPLTAVVHVDGVRVVVRDDLVYLALNKPVGVLSAMSDDRGRPTVGDLVADLDPRLFHVGRLDADSEGLLLLTNDGDLAHLLMHPSFGVVKTYLADVPAPIDRTVKQTLLNGVELEDGPAKLDSFRVVQTSAGRALVEVSLHEGRNRIVRRLLAEVGHPVQRLVRTAIGPLRLGSLRPGAIRELTRAEVGALHGAVETAAAKGFQKNPAQDSGPSADLA
ncbi:MAG TPA: pseudouridine synthase [Jatrophihabitantaceae bacterium]|nr:pseudouridine synthase [Jatrophihabitantaceae bacterium]